MDIFEAYIQENKRNENCRALTCKSYGNVYQHKTHKQLENNRTNFELATYGDALMKFALCSLLLDNCEQLSERKKKYEEDKFLIKVAEHYKLLEYMNFDREDEKILQNYVFEDGNSNRTKYIATTVEAVIGAIYQKYKDFDSICKLIKSWWDLK